MQDRRSLPVVVGVTGASGAALARRAVEKLLDLKIPVVLTASKAGATVWQSELGLSLDVWCERMRVQAGKGLFRFYSAEQIGAPVASGTYRTRGMLVIPCSMGTLAALAAGISNNLLLRASDVTIKENRRLVVVPRESPFSAIHLENMLKLTRLGVQVVPAIPAFYNRPQTIDDIIDFIAGRALIALGIDAGLAQTQRYGYSRSEAAAFATMDEEPEEVQASEDSLYTEDEL